MDGSTQVQADAAVVKLDFVIESDVDAFADFACAVATLDAAAKRAYRPGCGGNGLP